MENVDYGTVTSIDSSLVRDREVRSIDGHRAVRIERESSGEGIVPQGTLLTSYFIDLGSGVGDTGQVLVADTIDYTTIDYQQSKRVLDQMATTLQIDPDATAGVDSVSEFVAPPVESDGYPASGQPSWLTDVRFGVHERFERVVFEFDDSEDFSYSIEYVEEAVPASGDPIDVAGSHILNVVMTPASGVDYSGEEARETYRGSQGIDVSGDLVTELVQVEDFESVLTWAIGLERAANVAVTTMEEPHRLVIDLVTG